MLNTNEPSLLIVGHPRGMTSKTWEICQRATGLKPPGQTTDGELLNYERNNVLVKVDHFSAVGDCYNYFLPIMIGHRFGFILKDVMQPEFITEYRCRNPNRYRILYVQRDLDQVRDCQAERGWNSLPDPEIHQGMLKSIADETITFEEITEKPVVIFQTLERLGYAVDPYDYIDNKFMVKRDTVRFREQDRQGKILDEFIASRRK